MSLWLAALIVLALNLPFGYWRRRKTLRKFSLRWFLSIHAPVPLVAAIRVFGGLGWHPLTFVVLVGAFAAGQFLGGRLELVKSQT
ncbi:MAG: hypothetical protein Q7K41_02555 [Dehalococcoidales bacterium]|nr:hypothetical protein [Dehalococcoidales bacterium]